MVVPPEIELQKQLIMENKPNKTKIPEQEKPMRVPKI